MTTTVKPKTSERKGEKKYLRTFIPTASTIVGKAYKVDEDFLKVKLNDGSVMKIPYTRVHNIRPLDGGGVVVHTVQNTRASDHTGLYFGKVERGGIRYVVFQIEGFERKAYFREDLVEILNWG